MIDIKNILKEEIKAIISEWDEEDIYAISFFVESNEECKYREFENVVNFAISYNTEADCNGADEYDEERWNYAFWRQDETYIIYTDEENETADLLFDWYAENGITDIGSENEDAEYDANGYYIGKGPVGHYELLTAVSEIAKELQNEGFIFNQFKKELPIIIHGLEYAWYDIEATKNANPNGEADVFLKACEEIGLC